MSKQTHRRTPKEPRPLLSIGMIVKNESRCLERCLKSLQPLREAISCQIVVADTGSDDGTREIAAQYADVLFDFTWVNDFSAARNAVMDRCTGVWYMGLDADEWLDENFQPLLDYIQGPAGQAYQNAYVCERNYVSDDMEHYTDFFAGRLVRMDTGLRYQGAIHETLLDPTAESYVVEQVILHHDGYLPSVFRGDTKSKSDRNLKLLREELEQDPNNLIRILQCIESSGSAEEALQFAQQGIQTSKLPGATYVVVAPSIYRYGVKQALETGKPELVRTWLAEAEERFPNSLFIKVDAQALGMQSFYAQQDYAAAARAGLRWEEGLAAYDAGGKNRADLVIGTLQMLNQDHRSLLRCMLLDCLCHTEAWTEAARVLGDIQIKHLVGTNYPAMIQTLFTHGEHLDNMGPRLQRIWDETTRLAQEDAANWEGNKAYLLAAMNRQFSNAAGGAQLGIHHVLAELEDCEPGRSARILLSQDPEEIAGELAQVENWDEVLRAVFPHLLSLGLEPPQAFFARPRETQEDLVGELPGYDLQFTRTVLDYAAPRVDGADAVHLNWMLNLTVAALRTELWEDRAQCQALCDLFGQLTAAYLSRVYRPELLQEEQAAVLTGMHRFGWYYSRAQEALAGGDELGYIRLLRAGLEIAPVMKQMVDFLSKQLKRRSLALNPEMMRLARQVKQQLDQMRAEGSPGVDELMASPAYQKLAPWIEQVEEDLDARA